MPTMTKHFRTALRESGLFRTFSTMIAQSEEGDITPHAALYWFASDYHGGQSCPLYALLSQSLYTPGAIERECPEDAMPLYDTFRDVWMRNK